MSSNVTTDQPNATGEDSQAFSLENDDCSFCFDKSDSKRLYSISIAEVNWLGFTFKRGAMRRHQSYSGPKLMKFFLCVIGMVMIVEGLPYFAFPEKMKFWIQKIAGTPSGSLRRFGLALMVLGLAFVYFGRV